MVDDVNNFITETAESKASAEALDRSRLARERREAEQRKRLEELRAHAAAAQAQREKRDEDRRRRQAEQRARDDDRRVQVEERKRAIWEASISRREALLQREKDRTERLERARAARSSPRPAFAFGSSTPRLLEPLDSAGFFWAARRAASTSNVMFASAPLTRRASALQLDSSDTDNKDEPERPAVAMAWSSVARRRTDLVPTLPLGGAGVRAPGRAHSMTRLDRLNTPRPLHNVSPSLHHLNRTQTRSGETTPGSRPGSALSNATAGVVRRPTSTPRKPRPASIAGTGVNTPRGAPTGAGFGVEAGGSAASTPGVSRDGSALHDAPRRPLSTPRRPRPASMHVHQNVSGLTPGDGKPPPHTRKPKTSKDHDRTPRGKSLSVSPGRTHSPSPAASKEQSVDKEIASAVSKEQTVDKEIVNKPKPSVNVDKSHVSAEEVSQKLEALQINDVTNITAGHNQNVADKVNENKEIVETKSETKIEDKTAGQKEFNLVEVDEPVLKLTESQKPDKVSIEPQKPIEKLENHEKKETNIPKSVEKKEEKVEEKKEAPQEKAEDFDMTASMTARRITTEEEAKAALAERRRRAREELEKQAELERQRLQREAEEEAERQRIEEERQRREEEEARELAAFQRRTEEEKLRKAIEAQQQLEREEAEKRVREEAEKHARLKEEEEKRRAAEEAERLRKEEAEREEKERLVRKQRVEAIMARTRLKKAEEDKKNQEKTSQNQTQVLTNTLPPPPDTTSQQVDLTPQAADSATAAVPADNGNNDTGDLIALDSSLTQASATIVEEELKTEVNNEVDVAKEVNSTPNNGNITADLLGLSEQNNLQDKIQEQPSNINVETLPNISPPTFDTNNGNIHTPPTSSVGHVSANFIQTERLSSEHQTKMAENVPKLLDDDFTTHNGHGTHNHPLTLQNAI